ncbi:MAG: hypothetical protein AAF598_07460 [Bacteroidota bacterium]
MSNAISREFLGDHPTKKDQLFIFGITFLCLGIIGYQNFDALAALPLWRSLLFLLMVLDIIAGAIANFTKSTQDHYRGDPRKRVTFLLMHFIHIGLLILAVGHLWYALALLVYTLIGAFIVNATSPLKQAEINAAVWVCLGCILFYVVVPPPTILMWLPAILLLKLVFAFAVRREL